MTNIGVAHIEQLGSQENILKEKLHIQDGMSEKGTLFLNGDDPLLRDVVSGRRQKKGSVRTFLKAAITEAKTCT